VYAINNLGVGVPPDAPNWPTIQSAREDIYRYLLELAWDPSGLKRRALQVQLAKMPPLVRAQFFNSMKMAEARLEQQEHLLRMAAVQRLLKTQFEALMREQAKQAEILTKKVRELLKEDAQVIAEKLKDQQPMVRWLAALVAGRKRLHLEAELIDRLSDSYPQVREAAREALIRLSRGNDFGPLPKATAQQIAQSVQAWQQWLSLQDPPERIPEYLDRPYLAEAEQTPDVIREPLPRPQLAQAEDVQP
jgi:hypothetical protein